MRVYGWTLRRGSCGLPNLLGSLGTSHLSNNYFSSSGLPLEESFSDALTVQDDGSEASSFAPLYKFTYSPTFCGILYFFDGSTQSTVMTMDDPLKEVNTSTSSFLFGRLMISFWLGMVPGGNWPPPQYGIKPKNLFHDAEHNQVVLIYLGLSTQTCLYFRYFRW